MQVAWTTVDMVYSPRTRRGTHLRAIRMIGLKTEATEMDEVPEQRMDLVRF